MPQQSEEINQLKDKLNFLVQRQNAFHKELEDLKERIAALEWEEELVPELPPKEKYIPPQKEAVLETPKIAPTPPQAVAQKTAEPTTSFSRHFESNSDFEKFIGENLANKIGILITVLGVAIGGKYAIDNQLISPLTRIILGYLMGLGLLALALKLKPKYETYSAVLLSGAMAILYFITYFGYGLYGLFPQSFAFALMVIFTAFTIFAALKYDEQIIAGLGFVGAYAVPFLLSNNSGNVLFLFSYMTLLNVGILVIAFRKYWKGLFNAAFYFTWVIYLSWSFDRYNQDQHFEMALIFSALFFLIFYMTFLAYKVQYNEKLNYKNILLVLLNSFIYFGIGYGILEGHKIGRELLGLFTIFNGLLHFIVCRYLFLKKLTDQNLFYLAAGLVFVFITMAVPIQLEGSWVTLIWAFEAALLFWLGRTKGAVFYEKLSYILMTLAAISLLEDWGHWTPNFYYSIHQTEPSISLFLNHHFLTGILFIVAFGLIQWTIRNKKYTNPFPEKSSSVFKVFQYFIPLVLLIVLFNIFRIEILKYFQQSYFATAIPKTDAIMLFDESIILFKDIWLINFGLFFLTLLTIFTHKKIKNALIGQLNLGINILTIFIFFSAGLYLISEIREVYLNDQQGEYYVRGMAFHLIRYISLAFAGMLAFVTIQLAKAEFVKLNYPKIFETIIYFFLLWFLSSELLHWMDISRAKGSYKTALSILWGSFALLSIWVGIVQKKQHLRLAAMILFGVTLVKLFFYDIAHLDTIRKTIVMVSLGLLLLIISYLYNRFKTVLFDENE